MLAVEQVRKLLPPTSRASHLKEIVKFLTGGPAREKTRLAPIFHELADHSRNQSVWATAFYDMRRKAGHRHHAILRALAFKWIRIIFRCWKNRTTYDEQKYLQHLRNKNSPILKFIPATS